MKGRHKEAVSIMCRMAKANGRHLPEDITLTLMTDIKVSICFYVFMLMHFYVNKDNYKSLNYESNFCSAVNKYQSLTEVLKRNIRLVT